MPIPLPTPKPNKEKEKDKEKEKEKTKKSPRSLIKGGLAVLLLIIIAGIIAGSAFFFVRRRNNPYLWDGETFRRELAAFDALLEDAGLEKPSALNRALDRLEKKTLGLESRLSTLKRRRLLARRDPRFIPEYRKAAEQSAQALPFSEPLAAIAAESLLMGEEEEKNTEKIREYAGSLTEARLRPVSLGLRLLLGDLKDPERAGALPHKEALYTASPPELGLDLRLDLIILRILNHDIPAAAYQITGLLSNPGTRTPDTIRLAAEFFYDFGNLPRAGELFSLGSGERDLARQADALWLMGRVAPARSLWAALLSPSAGNASNPRSSPEVKARALYNLAATAENTAEKIAGFTRFLLEAGEDSPYRAYGVIAYARLLDKEQDSGVLEGEPSGNPLVDLELLRRQEEAWPLEKMIAETWLLVNRYPRDPKIYQWGCYFFDHQRRYDETARLIAQAARYHINTPSLALHESLRLIRADLLDEAEDRLKDIDGSIWQVPANMGRIREIRRNHGAALAYYQTAADLTARDKRGEPMETRKDLKNAANIYYSISRCFRALGEEAKSLGALEQALRFDPHYLNARLSLERAAP